MSTVHYIRYIRIIHFRQCCNVRLKHDLMVSLFCRANALAEESELVDKFDDELKSPATRPPKKLNKRLSTAGKFLLSPNNTNLNKNRLTVVMQKLFLYYLHPVTVVYCNTLVTRRSDRHHSAITTSEISIFEGVYAYEFKERW